MTKKKLKLKARRPLLRSDFRKTPKRRQIPAGIILIEGDGCIDTNKIAQSFPDKAKRLAYLQALIAGMDDPPKISVLDDSLDQGEE